MSQSGCEDMLCFNGFFQVGGDKLSSIKYHGHGMLYPQIVCADPAWRGGDKLTQITNTGLVKGEQPFREESTAEQVHELKLEEATEYLEKCTETNPENPLHL